MRFSVLSTVSVRAAAASVPPPPPRRGGGNGGSSRRRVRPEGDPQRDRCPVFQLYPGKQPVAPVDDVRDVHEICSQVPDARQRESIYIMHHLYGPGVEEYLTTVQYLERCLQKPLKLTRVARKPVKKNTGN